VNRTAPRMAPKSFSVVCLATQAPGVRVCECDSRARSTARACSGVEQAGGFTVESARYSDGIAFATRFSMSTAARYQYVVAALSIAAAIAAVCAATGIWPELPNVQLLLVASFAIAALYQTRARAERPTVAASDELQAARREIATLRATQEALAASEQKFRRLFEESRDRERQMRQAKTMDAVGPLRTHESLTNAVQEAIPAGS